MRAGRAMELKGRRVLVVGLARTGLATARFLVEQGAQVTVTESKPREAVAEAAAAVEPLGVSLEVGGHREATFAAAELIVMSPGVPLDLPPLRQARARGVQVVSEIELAAWFLRLPVVAVTGTNGKSTTTTLIGEMLRAGGRRAFVGGNLGTPLVTALLDAACWEIAVAEVSSFQLEAIERFHAHVAVLLNVTEDHLDRHESFKAYAQAKQAVFRNQGPEDWAVLNADDPVVEEMAGALRARPLRFSRRGPVARGAWLEGATIRVRLDRGEEAYPTGLLRVPGVHNLENAMAAILAARACGVQPSAIAQALAEFPGLPHRLEFVREVGGVRYYNDSKGTNVGAVVKSVSSFPGPLVLIMGGLDKGGSYAPLQDLVRERARALVVLGQARERIRQALADVVPTTVADSFEEGVRQAAAAARPGDVVLLSPGCASFDMFRNYEERGARFRALVQAL